MPDPAPLLEAAALGRRHPTAEAKWLLERISLNIPAGARLSVAGPSGAGKTLLLRSLAKLDPIDAGEVFYRGRAIGRDNVPAFRAAVIYLHQRAALLEETVEAALRRPFALRIHRHRIFDHRRVLPWLTSLGRAEEFLPQRVENLSGGEIQIVALLRALQLDPAILLLDEPTAALDPTTAAAMERMLVEWVEQSSEHRALVWVSHDAAQAQRVARQFIRLEGGRVVESSE